MFNHITLPLSFSFPLSLQKPIPSFFQNHPHPHPNYPHLNFTLPLPKKKKKRKRIPTYLHYTIQMEHTKMEMGLVLVVMAMLCAGAAAQSQSSCTNVLVSLSPCLNYITGNSSTPSSGCCSQLASVVRSQPQCLCQVLSGGGSSLGININQTQALALPVACKVQTPPTSQCNNGK